MLPGQNSKPRVLVIENGIAITGSVKSIVRSSQVLRERFDFVFLLPSNSQASAYVKMKGFTVEEIPMRELKSDVLAVLVYGPILVINLIRFVRLLRRYKIDLIHSNDFYNLIPCIYKMLGGHLPYICHVRFMPSRFPRILVGLWCFLHKRYASSVIAVSQALKRELIYADKVKVIGDGLPSEEIEYSKATSNIILYPANFTRGKGHEYALRSFEAISTKYPTWKLRVIGSDFGLKKNADYKKELVAMAAGLGIEKQVEWGNFSQNMASEYKASSIVLNFSESESFSLTCLEALYYGRPVIATDSGGPAEIIDHGESGLMVPTGDVVSMYLAMEALMQDADRRERMGLVGRTRVRERYSLEQTMYRLRDQYLAVINV